jgi:transcriptional regulator with XRE-family HTH domain
MVFGLLLKAYRQQEGISLRKLAKIIGVQFSALHRFETGHEIEARHLVRIFKWALTDKRSPSAK